MYMQCYVYKARRGNQISLDAGRFRSLVILDGYWEGGCFILTKNIFHSLWLSKSSLPATTPRLTLKLVTAHMVREVKTNDCQFVQFVLCTRVDVSGWLVRGAILDQGSHRANKWRCPSFSQKHL